MWWGRWKRRKTERGEKGKRAKERENDSGKMSVRHTEIMKPAASAIIALSAWLLHFARTATTSAPTTFAAAPTSPSMIGGLVPRPAPPAN